MASQLNYRYDHYSYIRKKKAMSPYGPYAVMFTCVYWGPFYQQGKLQINK